MKENKYIRIGDVAKQLEVKEFVIRFWEKEFGIKAHRSQGKQRHYAPEDVTRLGLIKELLYQNGFTISGAKKHLKDMQKELKLRTQATPKLAVTAATRDVSPAATPEPLHATPPTDTPCTYKHHLLQVRNTLITLRSTLS
jgi:DNA-binding transcriptional MerR regulator